MLTNRAAPKVPQSQTWGAGQYVSPLVSLTNESSPREQFLATWPQLQRRIVILGSTRTAMRRNSVTESSWRSPSLRALRPAHVCPPSLWVSKQGDYSTSPGRGLGAGHAVSYAVGRRRVLQSYHAAYRRITPHRSGAHHDYNTQRSTE